MQVIIIGAGIGGLTTAIALQQRGIAATVYERSPQLRTSGAGISLWPNASRLLQRLNLLEALLGQGEQILHTQICSSQGRPLTQLDLTTFPDPAFCIQRSVLLQTLAAALLPGTLHLDHDLTQVDRDHQQVTARFRQGQDVTADLLVAADGLHSTVRSQFWAGPAPQYQGYLAWRGVVRQQKISDWPSGLARQYWGAGQRVGLLSMGGDQMYWFAALNHPSPQPNLDGLDKLTYLKRRFQHWHPHVQTILENTASADLLVHPIETSPPLQTWHQGRVLLLGDAAHAMTPNLGQGACMAIEDGVCLAQRLQSQRSLPAALVSYERQRRGRVRWVQRRSQRLGQVGQLEPPLLAHLRNLALALVPAPLTRLTTFDPLFSHRL
ncbi:FAD-dependent oxidoreductase [Lyngbya confervoides]|uniref:FAD-dependent oxidoreductase n=1 Tax=Lyngbya confervoides BDU141951 TaxID=1574623 RepID=A0ABD4T729_9CYAN|nr:FAD-dependent oxidoreductase [Lyngbya confervoides]MCM1984281.1 FAD-dependent oxidoreductase [Lyngbya confervoides BDU141951]